MTRALTCAMHQMPFSENHDHRRPIGYHKGQTQSQRQLRSNLWHVRMRVSSCVMAANGAHIDHVPPGELREGEAAVGRRLLRRRPLPREQRLPLARRKELEVVRGVRVDPCQHDDTAAHRV